MSHSQSYNHLMGVQKEENRRVKQQGMDPMKKLLTQPPFSYDEEMAEEICNDLTDGMELHLNAGVSTAENDVEMVNRLGKDLSSLNDNAFLYCILDQEADAFMQTTLEPRKEKNPLILYSSSDVKYDWPANTENFSLTNIVKVATLPDLATAIAIFLNDVAMPYNKSSSWIANIVVMGFRDGEGVILKDCPGEVLDIPTVLDYVDDFKKRAAKPDDLKNPKRGPYATRVVFCHNEVDAKYPIEFGFKQYFNHETGDVPTFYNFSKSILLHPDDERYITENNGVAQE